MPLELQEGNPKSEFTSLSGHWKRQNLNQTLREAGLINKDTRVHGYLVRQGWMLDLTGTVSDTAHIL